MNNNILVCTGSLIQFVLVKEIPTANSKILVPSTSNGTQDGSNDF